MKGRAPGPQPLARLSSRYCGAMFMVPSDSGHVLLAGLLYVPDRFVDWLLSEPCTEITVLLEASVTVMVKLLPLVVAVALSVLASMHMLLGAATLPV